MNFYDKFVSLCATKGVKPSRAAMDMSMSKSAVTSWKSRGTSPTTATQQIIANYFDIPISELMDFEEKEKAPSVDEALDGIMIAKLKELSEQEKARVEAYIDGILSSRKV